MVDKQVVGFDIGVSYTVLPGKKLQEKFGDATKELVLHIAYRPTDRVTVKGKPLSNEALDSLVEGHDKGLTKYYGQAGSKGKDSVTPTKDSYAVNDITEIKKPSKRKEADPTAAVIFTLDRSGSMGSGYSHEGSGKLERAKESIVSSLEKLAKEKPDTLVGLVTYDDTINVYNLKTGEKKALNGYLDSVEGVKNAMDGNEYKMVPASEAAKQIKEILKNVTPGNMTALGPAMTLSAILLGEQAGTVTIATDGLANVGLGAVENAGGRFGTESKELEQMRAVYNEIAQLFVGKGKVCNVVGILDQKETEAKDSNSSNKLCLDIISIPAYATSGSLRIVDPTGQGVFNEMINKTLSTYATNVQIEIEHPGMKIKRALHGQLIEKNGKSTIKAPAVIGKDGYTQVIFDISDLEKHPNLGVKIAYQTKGGQTVEMKPSVLKFPVTDDETRFKEGINKAVVSANVVSEMKEEIFRRGYSSAEELMHITTLKLENLDMHEEAGLACEARHLCEVASNRGGMGDHGSVMLMGFMPTVDDPNDSMKKMKSLRKLVDDKEEKE